MLAALLLDAGRVVGIDWLIAAVWDDRPPPSARNTLQSYVSNLRRLVGGVLVARPGGYQLDVEPGPSHLRRT